MVRAELEDMIDLITNLLNADQYNGNFFKVGSSPQGILTYKVISTRIHLINSGRMAANGSRCSKCTQNTYH
jgi:hypothetical protein